MLIWDVIYIKVMKLSDLFIYVFFCKVLLYIYIIFIVKKLKSDKNKIICKRWFFVNEVV